MVEKQPLVFPILRCVERRGGVFDVEIMAQEIADDNTLLKDLLLILSHEVSEEIEEHSETAKVLVNPGGLYRDVIFELSVYTNIDGGVVYSYGFGQAVNPMTTMHSAVRHIVEVLQTAHQSSEV